MTKTKAGNAGRWALVWGDRNGLRKAQGDLINKAIFRGRKGGK